MTMTNRFAAVGAVRLAALAVLALAVGCGPPCPPTPDATPPPHKLAAFPTFPATTGGGLSTVTTSAPVSGGGSVGSPVTIANGAMTLPKLASQAANTIVANATSGSASPTAVALDTCSSFSGGVLTNLCPFSADTIVKLNNTTPAPVSAWEGTAGLLVSTPGSEQSNYVIKTLTSGAQATALDMRAGGMYAGSNGSGTLPFWSFLNSGSSGMYYAPTGGFGGVAQLGFSLNGGSGGGAPDFSYISGRGLQIRQNLYFGQNLNWMMGNTASNGMLVNSFVTTNGAHSIQVNGAEAIGVAANLNVNLGKSNPGSTATAGFAAIPASAGPPTGVVTPPTGYAALYVDSTAHKVYVNDGSGWVALN